MYNLNTAQANQINANTFIMLNEYMWNAVKNENRENWAKRMELVRRRIDYRQKIQDRIHNHPEALDVTHGDALSAVLGDLLDPKVDDSTSRYAQVPLDPDFIRRIPFKLAEKGEAFSMNRLSVKRKWSVAFQDPRFKLWREAYEHAVDDALELAMDGRMNQKALDAVLKAVNDLEEKVARTPYLLDPDFRREAGEAKQQLGNLRKTVNTFQTFKVQAVLGEIDKYSGTTVDDLRIFMRKHNLTFAAAEMPDERILYPQLYTALILQRDKSTIPERALGK